MNMDRFKFRVWDNLQKEYFGFNGKTYTYDLTHYLYNERTTVEQCTGLKDKNGRLIFEGDIVQDIEYSRPTPLKYKLFWSEKAAGIRMKCISHPELKKYSNSTAEYKQNHLEIIGNIHESEASK